MSYMDRKNIIEGFFDLFKKLPKDVKRLKLNTFEKQLYKTDPEFKKSKNPSDNTFFLSIYDMM